MKVIALNLFLLFPFLLFSQDEIDSLLINNESDTTQSIVSDTLDTGGEIETTVNYVASDSIFYNLENQKISMFGESNIDYGSINLQAEEIEVDWNKKTIDANFKLDSLGKKVGKPIFSEDNQSYETDKITYNFDSKKAKIKGIVTQLDDAYMQGKDVKKNEFDELFIHDAKYTTCNLAEPHFHISARKIKVIPGKKVVSGPFHLKFRDVPTPLGFIFGMFPQPKKTVSGIIMPNYGEEKRRGFYLRDGGYYFAVNEKLDLQLTGDVYSKGSYGLSLGTNYKKRYAYNGSLRFDYNSTKMGEFEDSGISKDFSLAWSHSPDSRGKSSRFSSSVNFQTNSYNQNKNLVYSNFNESINAQFNSNISYSKTFKGTPFNFSANLRHSQNVQTKKVNLTLPDISYNMSRIYPFKNVGKLGKTALGKLSISHRFTGRVQLSNVGIGSTSPGQKLTVSGNISACGGLSATKAPNFFACNVGINTNRPSSYLQVSALKTIDRDLAVFCGGGVLTLLAIGVSQVECERQPGPAITSRPTPEVWRFHELTRAERWPARQPPLSPLRRARLSRSTSSNPASALR